MNYKKGKKIESREEFVKGEKYVNVNGEVFTFEKIKEDIVFFLHEGQKYELSDGLICFWWCLSLGFYQAIPDISREVYEEVLMDYNEFIHGDRELYPSDKKYLNYKFKPITKLDRMIEDLKKEAKRNDMDVDVVFK